MKKLIIGFLSGAILAGGTAVYANDSIQALLFPAKYTVNDVEQKLPDGYQTLEVDGHAYVPIRFVAEALDAVVAYDETSMRINVDNGYLKSQSNDLRVGHITVTRKDEAAFVQGKLFVGQNRWEAMVNAHKSSITPGGEYQAGGTLMFYGAEGQYLGKATINETLTASGDQIKEFATIADPAVSGYAFVMLANENPSTTRMPTPPDITIFDSKSQLGVGDIKIFAHDGFTEVRGWNSLRVAGQYRVRAVLTFLDDKGLVLGTAPMETLLSGEDPKEGMKATSFVTAGKGNFTNYSKVELRLDQLEPVSDSDK